MHSRQKIIQPHQLNPEPTVVPGNVFELLVRSLLPATSYNCSIHATTRKGSGESTSIVVWTKSEGRYIILIWKVFYCCKLLAKKVRMDLD